MKRIVLVILLSIAGSASGASPLFESDVTLTLTIEAPMRELIRKRRARPELDAVVHFTDSNGEIRSINAKVSSRGNSRLESCGFPPLRLEFSRADTAGTPFEGQRRLKMVTQCDRGSSERAWLLQEYGIYRAYNVITDYSYRVRKLDITYQDSTSSRWTRESPAFFIESTHEAAERLERSAIRPPRVRPDQFDRGELARNLLFQYLIANTDLAVLAGPTGEGCCHNGRVLTRAGSQAEWIVLPYDFDQAGIINTDYAIPDERLRIKSVTRRLYRGFCWLNDSLPETIAVFNERREQITDALVPAGVSSSKQARIRRMTDRFYDIINDAGKLQDSLTDKCRGAAGFPIRKTTTDR